MKRTEIIEKIVDGVKTLLPDRKVVMREVVKNNNCKMIGISISVKEDNEYLYGGLSANVYIDELLDAVEIGDVTIDEAASSIVRSFHNRVPEAESIPALRNLDKLIKDKDEFLARVRRSVVNTEMNSGDLELYPHKSFCDLTVMYRLFLNDEASFKISYDNLNLVGITEEELDEAAVRNEKDSYICMTIMDLLVKANPSYAAVGDPTDGLMKVLTNKSRFYGATAILDTEFLKDVARGYESDMYILPCSINELITIPATVDRDDLPFLLSMVRDVNSTVLAQTDILSDSIYKFDKNTNEVMMLVA